MVVTSEEIKRTYTGTGATDTYAYPFQIYKAADILVTETLIATGVETILSYGTDYTLTNINVAGGGNVVLVAGVLPSTKKLTVELNLEYKQETIYPPADPFPAKTTETALDKCVRMIQQVKALVSRTFILPTTTTTPITIPVPEAGKVLTGVSATEVAWQALVYTTTDYNGTISRGLAAAIPAVPSVGDIYLATDTGKLYTCKSAGVWTHYALVVNDLTAKTTAVAADIFLLEDSAASFAQKKITLTNLLASLAPSLNKVAADSGDATPGYLGDKVDGTSLQVSTADKLEILPALVTALKYRRVAKLMEVSRTLGGGDAMAAIMESGDLRTWGTDLKCGGGLGAISFQVPVHNSLPSTATLPIAKVYQAHSNMYVIDANGWVFATGLNAEGELGDGGVVTPKHTFNRVGTLTGVSKLIIPKGTALAADTCVYALKTDGTVWAWGQNTGGHLGTGGVANVLNPTQISIGGGGGVTVVDLAANGILPHAIAACSDGSAWACGLNTAGQLGLGDTTVRHAFTKITHAGIAAKTVVKVYCSGEAATGTSFFVCSDGAVWGCGDNSMGQLCDGTTTDSTVPKVLATVTGVLTNGNGLCVSWDEYGSMCAVKTNGHILTWGYNSYGQLGDGSATNRTSVYDPGFTQATKAVWGGTGSYGSFYVLTSDGAVYSSGYGVAGNNGDGTITTAPNVFKACVGYPITKATDISASGAGSYYRPMILCSDGRMYVAGDNTTGCLGIGHLLTPSAVFVPPHF